MSQPVEETEWVKHGPLYLGLIIIVPLVIWAYVTCIQPVLDEAPQALEKIKTVDCKTLLSEFINYTADSSSIGMVNNVNTQFWTETMSQEYKNRCAR